MSQSKPISTSRLLFYIFGIVIVGVLTFYLVEDWIVDKIIIKDNLQDLTYVYGLLGFVVSLITILLLYHNYRQSQIEFNKISESNNAAIDVQMILYEKQKIDERFKYLEHLYSENQIGFSDYLVTISMFEFTIGGVFGKLENIDDNLDMDEFRKVSNIIRVVENHINSIKKIVKNREVINTIYSCFPIGLIHLINTLDRSFDFTELENFINSNYERNSESHIRYTKKIWMLRGFKTGTQNIKKIITEAEAN